MIIFVYLYSYTEAASNTFKHRFTVFYIRKYKQFGYTILLVKYSLEFELM